MQNLEYAECYQSGPKSKNKVEGKDEQADRVATIASSDQGYEQSKNDSDSEGIPVVTFKGEMQKQSPQKYETKM